MAGGLLVLSGAWKSHMGNLFCARAARLAVLVLAGTPVLSPTVGSQSDTHVAGPFEPGLRWSDGADPGAPWVPRDVAFAGHGELVWTGAALASPQLLLHAAGELGAAQPAQVDAGLAGAIGTVHVAGGASPDALYALTQYPSPLDGSRLTRVTRNDRSTAASGGAFGPLWTRDFAELTAGNARLASDDGGGALVAALYEKEAGRVHIDWIDPCAGGLVSRVTVDGSGLSALEISAGGTRALVVCGLDLWIVAPDGTVLHHELLGATTEAADLSGDGRTVVVGGFGGARVLRFDGGAYQPAFSDVVSPQYVATRAAVSHAGETVAVGYWNVVKGSNVRLRVLDGSSAALLNETVQAGAVGGLQNYPEAVSVTPDGRRVAYGLWGACDAKPDVLLVERGVPGNVMAVNLPGSVYSLALDATGTRLAVGMKDAHANLFATTGEVRLYDTGERDMQVLGAPGLGGTLLLAARTGDAGFALFLLGTEGAAPFAVPGVAAPLLLDPAQPLLWFPGVLGGDGTATLSLTVPSNPALLASQVAAQAVTVGAGGVALSTHHALPVLL